jgi:hypothetical protein
MKKVGSSFKNLGAIFLGLVLLFLLFSMFSGTREGFAYTDRGCTISTTCDKSASDSKKICNGNGTYARFDYKCQPSGNTYKWLIVPGSG